MPVKRLVCETGGFATMKINMLYSKNDFACNLDDGLFFRTHNEIVKWNETFRESKLSQIGSKKLELVKELEKK